MAKLLALLRDGLVSPAGLAARYDLANCAPAGTTVLVYDTKVMVPA